MKIEIIVKMWAHYSYDSFEFWSWLSLWDYILMLFNLCVVHVRQLCVMSDDINQFQAYFFHCFYIFHSFFFSYRKYSLRMCYRVYGVVEPQLMCVSKTQHGMWILSLCYRFTAKRLLLSLQLTVLYCFFLHFFHFKISNMFAASA